MRELYVFLPLFWGVSLCALVYGDRDERAVAIIYAGGAIVSPFVVGSYHHSFAGVETGLLVVDGLTFLGIAVVALGSRKFWPLWVTWLLGVTLISHLSPLLGQHISPWGYALAEKFWSYLPLFILGGATWQHRKRLTQRTAASG